MKKKLMSVLLSLAVVTTMLAGCGNSDSDTKAPESTNAKTENTDGESTDASDETNADSKSSDDTATTDGKGLESIKSYGKLKVGCKIDVPGYGLQNTDTQEYEGLEIDLAYAIAGKIFGVTADEAKEQGLCEFQGVTAKTRGPLLDNGEIDVVIATFTITEERKESYNFSTAYIEDAIGLMCSVDSGYKTMADIDGALIGVAQGATTQEAIKSYIVEKGLDVNVTFEEFDGYPSLSAALSAGNIDIFSVDRAILGGYVDDTTMILPERFATQEYGVASALTSTELAALVDDLVVEMLDNGGIDDLKTKWEIN